MPLDGIPVELQPLDEYYGFSNNNNQGLKLDGDYIHSLDNIDLFEGNTYSNDD